MNTIDIALVAFETGVVVGGFYYLFQKTKKQTKIINNLEWKYDRAFDRIIELERKLSSFANNKYEIADIRADLREIRSNICTFKQRIDKMEKPFEIIHGKENKK